MADSKGAGETERPAFCSAPNDFYESAARRTMGDLCEDVFAPLFLTPSEFLHSEFHQRTLYSAGALLGAFQKAAQTQAEILDVTPQVRLRRLTALFDGVVDEVRDRGKRFTPSNYRPAQFPAIAADIGGRFKGGERLAALLSGLSVYLDGSGSWLAKIQKIVLLYTDDLDSAAVEACDRILGEIILSRSAMGELLGTVISLEEVTPLLIALHDSARTDGGPPDRGDVVTRQSTLANIARLIATGRFLWTRTAVADVIRRVLEGPKRYRKEESGSEIMAVLDTFALFDTASAQLRETTVADALRMRVSWALSATNLDKYRDAESRVDRRLENLVMFLDFTDSAYQRGILQAEIERALRDPKLLSAMERSESGLVERLETFARLHDRLEKAPLDAFAKLAMLGRISRMQARFLHETDFFNQLAESESDVVVRAMLLLDFCRRRVFLMGAGFKYAKHRVRDIISSDAFRALYLKDCKNDREAAQRLGDLKNQLDRAGLMD